MLFQFQLEAFMAHPIIFSVLQLFTLVSLLAFVSFTVLNILDFINGGK